jgi:uncharacterized protein (TIGR00661 family)
MRRRILYGIQGTGNGHIVRSIDIIKRLARVADIDILISGDQCDIKCPYPVKYAFSGIQFAFGKTGGIDYRRSVSKLRFIKTVKDILSIPIKYDLVISDFEPVSAYYARVRGVFSIAVSHQAALFQPGVPMPPKRSKFFEAVIRLYAPCDEMIAIHFREYNSNIVEPVIREAIREATEGNVEPNEDQYLAYLPAFNHEELARVLARTNKKWAIFSKWYKGAPRKFGNIEIYQAGQGDFALKFAESFGILSNAGFETNAEALFMGKKLLVMPMRGQYEQACNAAALKELGATVCDSTLTALEKTLPGWVEDVEKPPKIQFCDSIPKIIDRIQSHLQ